MKIIDCPVIGRRPVSEFTIAGVLEAEPEDLGDWSPGRWAFERNSVPMTRDEWWFHDPSGLWFHVRRDTAANRIISVDTAHE